ncbi:MAG TPA: hypothetical protein VGK97_00910 [Spongiibacteraceae bacterium]
MSKKLIAAAIAFASMHSALSQADTSDQSMFSFRGFGTVGVVHSSEKGADYVGTVFQPNGAGRTHEWDMNVDSKLGAQVTATFSDKFSAVIQAVSQHQYDNSYRPLIEWANVKYQATSELSIRAGRIVLPSFLISDSRLVGYANPWIRPPEEVYFIASITNNDGADITYRSQIGDATNSLQAFYGSNTTHAPTSTVKSKPSWGLNDSVELGSLTLRAGYISSKLDLNVRELEPLLSGLDQFGDAAVAFGFQSAGNQAHAMADKYSLSDIQVHIYTLGANYDPGNWFVMAEVAKFDAEGFLADSKAGYVTGGYRFGKFTPYVTIAKVKSDSTTEDGISTAGLPGAFADGATSLNAGINAVLPNFPKSQKSASIGVRWDFMRSADLKVQYDRLSLEDDTTGRLTNAETGFDGGKVNVISAAIDFVF